MSRRRNALVNHKSNGSLAQFFTPYEIAKFICRAAWIFAAGLGKQAKFIDPAAGKGVFLEAVLALGKVPVGNVYGIEIDSGLESQRSEKARRARFYTGDGLLQGFPGVDSSSFDLVVGNPPFGRLDEILPKAYLDQVCRDIEEWKSFSVWRLGHKGKSPESARRSLQRTAIDLLFVERAMHLAKPGGLIAFIMPEGFFANTSLQRVRDWVLEKSAVLGVVGLPDTVFRRCYANAKTEIVFLRKGVKDLGRNDEVMFVSCSRQNRDLGGSLARKFEKVLSIMNTKGRNAEAGIFFLPESRLRGARWDVDFWERKIRSSRLHRRFALFPLGDFIEHLTYGPIVPGRRPLPVEGGIQVIRQGDIAETGLRCERRLYVPESSEFDPMRSRVRSGDLLLPRSGAGTLGKNRMAVYLEEKPANIGCFVDLIRLAGINPFFVWFYLKTRPGWAQIRAAINGVGTPNINFSEIRALGIPSPPLREQENLERRYLAEVWPLHCRRTESTALCAASESRFRKITADLERFLEGK